VLVKFEFTALKRTRWHEYLTRFLFGGAVTLAAGLIADKFGPGIGGLFLAFPAIFPASASLIQKHEREKKKAAGLEGSSRGRVAAGVDALGATLGALGLIAYAIVTWKLLPTMSPVWTLMIALCAWAGVSTTAWFVRKRLWKRVAPIGWR
jgi:hypothetical protein